MPSSTWASTFSGGALARLLGFRVYIGLRKGSGLVVGVLMTSDAWVWDLRARACSLVFGTISRRPGLMRVLAPSTRADISAACSVQAAGAGCKSIRIHMTHSLTIIIIITVIIVGTPGAAVPTARLATFPTCQADAARGGLQICGLWIGVLVWGFGALCGMTFTEYTDWLSRFCLAHVGGLGATLTDHFTHLTRRRTQLDGMLHAVCVCVCVCVCSRVCVCVCM